MVTIGSACRYDKASRSPIIDVAWRHTGEVGRVHHRAKRSDGSSRHLFTREGTHYTSCSIGVFKPSGYTGPKSAEEGSAEH
jgi:hypothetical protein